MDKNNINESEALANGAFPYGNNGADELLLHRYLDQRLDEKERAQAERMLRSSIGARRHLDGLREEENLIRESLEIRSEQGKRLGDKVIATLHAEERHRLYVLRARRLRTQIGWVVGAAACLLLTFFLARPREAAGTAVSGSSATVITQRGEHRALTHNMRVYEGDQLCTAQGQFVRIQFSNAIVDIDENSRLSLERSENGPSLRLDAGRLGIEAGKDDVTVSAPQGTARVTSGAHADVWVPEPSAARWPEMLASPPPGQSVIKTGSAADLSSVSVVCVTVFSGTVYVGNSSLPSGVPLAKGYSAMLGAHTRSIRKVDLAGSRVLDTRSGPGWHTVDSMASGRTDIGLLECPDFVELGSRLHMTENAPAVSEALKLLRDGMQSGLAQRAEKLAAGQQALRTAYEPFKATDERRRCGRMLEGLAHLQRGLALASTADTGSATAAATEQKQAAYAAFRAACVAFEEALDPVFTGSAPTTDTKPWVRSLVANNSATLAVLLPDEQTALLAAFFHPVALSWQQRFGIDAAQNETGAPAENLDAAKEFAKLRLDLGRSVEALAARLAEGLALSQAGNLEKAVDALQEVVAEPLAGYSPVARQHTHGLKQAALVALVKIFAQEHEAISKAQSAAEDFWLLCPLENASPAGREIVRVLDEAEQYKLNSGKDR